MVVTLQYAVKLLFNFLEYAIFIDIILSWVMPGKRNGVTDLLHVFTEPFLIPGRKIQQKIMPGFMMDFSPIIAFMLLSLIERIIIATLGVFA